MVNCFVENGQNLRLPGPGRVLHQTCHEHGAEMEPDFRNALAFGQVLSSLPHLNQPYATGAFISHTYSQL
jgi:hypothetical protein